MDRTPENKVRSGGAARPVRRGRAEALAETGQEVDSIGRYKYRKHDSEYWSGQAIGMVQYDRNGTVFESE